MNSRKILIVDDDLNIQNMLRTCLERPGCLVQQAYDGAQALEVIQQWGPDLVLLDLAMPVLDGMSVLADLRKLMMASETRVIVMTAHGSVRTALQAVRLGASDFLEKPFSPDDLRQSVNSVLNHPADEVKDEVGYQAALESVRDALRRGKFIAAEASLMKAGTIAGSDPSFFNLAGVLHEAHGRLSSARNFYRKALAAQPAYRPAADNLQRLDEFEKTGSTVLPIALGDGDEPRRLPDVGASFAARFKDILAKSVEPPKQEAGLHPTASQ